MYYNTNKLKELRKLHKYSQLAVAKKLFIEQTTYSAIESGHTKVEVDRAQQIAALYGVHINEIIETNSINMVFNDKVENGFASYIQTLNTENKGLIIELIDQFKIQNEQLKIQNEQLKTRDEIMVELMKVISTKLV
jgi:transcriptional regulator with XRE-family HTH domain